MPKKWYKLDNAAKIFPVIYSQRDKNSFRVAAVFKDEIDPSKLKTALDKSLERFPTFCVKIKRGFFWYYFDHNFEKPIIKEEDSVVFNSVKLHRNNGFMFTLSYFGKRLALEVFHALSDGTGGMEFLKTICYYYLTECGINIINNGEIKTGDVERTLCESEDSFDMNYSDRIKKYGLESKAYQLKGKYYNNNWCGIVHAIMNVNELKEVSKRYGATITQYIGASVLLSIYQNYYIKNPSKKKIKLFIPVNARKFFDSQSLRNFVLYIRTNCDFYGKDLTFEDAIELMKTTFEKELNEERLLSRLASNVGFEKKMIVRLLPLFIKKIGMKIGYKILGSDANSVSFSNLGIVNIPNEMRDHIERFEFMIGVSRATPVNLASVSYNQEFVLSFSSKLIDRKLIKTILNQLVQDGIKITVETNDLEFE